MKNNFKSQLKVLLENYSKFGRGPFAQWVHEQRVSVAKLSDGQLADGFIAAYGADLIASLKSAKLSKFYEKDLVSVLGRERELFVQIAAFRRLETPKTNPEKPVDATKPKSGKVLYNLLSVGFACFILVHYAGKLFNDAPQAPSDPQSQTETSQAAPVDATNDTDTDLTQTDILNWSDTDFDDCASYVGWAAGLQCINAEDENFGQNQYNQDNDTRYAASQKVQNSKWRRDPRCEGMADTAIAEAQSIAVQNLAKAGNYGTIQLAASDVNNACLQAGNVASYQVCSSIPSGCPSN